MNELLDARRIPAVYEATTPVQPEDRTADRSETWWRQWNWRDGRIWHYVPHGWRFPANITLKAVYDLWHFGNRNEGIRPYKKLPLNIDIIDQDKGNRSKAKNAIECIENVMRGEGYIDDVCILPDRDMNISNMTPIESDTIYEQAYNKLITYISSNVAVRRVDELSYVRVYQLICNRKKQQQLNNDD